MQLVQWTGETRNRRRTHSTPTTEDRRPVPPTHTFPTVVPSVPRIPHRRTGGTTSETGLVSPVTGALLPDKKDALSPHVPGTPAVGGPGEGITPDHQDTPQLPLTGLSPFPRSGSETGVRGIDMSLPQLVKIPRGAEESVGSTGVGYTWTSKEGTFLGSELGWTLRGLGHDRKRGRSAGVATRTTRPTVSVLPARIKNEVRLNLHSRS